MSNRKPLEIRIGHDELIIRPVIRLARQVHLQKVGGSRAAAVTETARDF